MYTAIDAGDVELIGTMWYKLGLSSVTNPLIQVRADSSTGTIILNVTPTPINPWAQLSFGPGDIPPGTRSLYILMDGRQSNAFDSDDLVLNYCTASGMATFDDRIYECTTAGTTAVSQPTYANTIGSSSTDGSAVFKAYLSYTSQVVISQVINNREFVIGSTGRTTGFFDEGTCSFQTGANNGSSMEIKGYDSTTNRIVLYEPMPLDIAVNDRAILASGCDKRLTTCINKFRIDGSISLPTGNNLNYRGEPHLPGRDKILRQRT